MQYEYTPQNQKFKASLQARLSLLSQNLQAWEKARQARYIKSLLLKQATALTGHLWPVKITGIPPSYKIQGVSRPSSEMPFQQSPLPDILLL